MTRPLPTRLTLAHPISVGSIVLLVVNDHVLKHQWPGPITGKLSDLAGLVFLPLLIISLVELTTTHRWRYLPVTAVVLTGLSFSLIQVWEPAAELYRTGLGWIQWPFRYAIWGANSPTQVNHTADPTDLLALPALALSWMIARYQPTPLAQASPTRPGQRLLRPKRNETPHAQ